MDSISKAKYIISESLPGANYLSYILFNFTNISLVNRLNYDKKNSYMSDLNFNYKCIPFEKMPYAMNPMKYGSKLSDLYKCIPFNDEYNGEVLYRKLRKKSNDDNQIYVKIKTFQKSKNEIIKLIESFNKKLTHHSYKKQEIILEKDYIYIKNNEDEFLKFIENVKKYENNCFNDQTVIQRISKIQEIDDEKKFYLENIFKNQKFSFVYGPAGSGKTKFIEYVSEIFSSENFIFLSSTHTAVQNLRKRIRIKNGIFSTLTYFLKNYKNLEDKKYFLVIDECGFISNENINKILSKYNYKFILFVGDDLQLQPIELGNWFSYSKEFFKDLILLRKNYRTDSKELIKYWNSVRNLDSKILENSLRENIFSKINVDLWNSLEYKNDDEITLALKYDGIFGINNLNQILQSKNNSDFIFINHKKFCLNDPVIFSKKIESYNIINGSKGQIIEFKECDNKKSIFIRLNSWEIHEQHYNSDTENLPFQIAYAISIHRAQGLEFESVRVVIDQENDENDLLSFETFYTAITRAKNKLKIYWDKSSEKKVFDKFKEKKERKKERILILWLLKRKFNYFF